MQKSHNEVGAVELLLLAGLALLWALWTVARLVLVPVLALLLSWCCRASTDGTAPAVTAPAALPLAQLASEAAAPLQPLTVAQLRAQARAAGLPRSLSRRGRREALEMALAGCSVALI